MGCRIEPGDGRIIAAVTITAATPEGAAPAPVVAKELVADSGGITMIPLANLKPLIDRKLIRVGPMQETNFGPAYRIVDAIMETEVQLPDGTVEKRTCHIMEAHTLEDGIFLSADGLLGMDQFDQLSADPAKNRARDHAFLRART